MPRLPFDEMDLLIVDRLGKNISGAGMDPNITGRYPTPFATGGPRVTKQVVLDLTNETDGNAVYPTPVIGVVGLLEHADRVVRRRFQDSGDVILLFGQNHGG